MKAEFKKIREQVTPMKVGDYIPVTVDKHFRKELEREVPKDLYYEVKAENGRWTFKNIETAEIVSRLIRVEDKLNQLIDMIIEALKDEEETNETEKNNKG